MEKVDIAIVGSGPAGISAALNAKIRNKSYYLFGSANLSDKVQKSECISNYPGISDIGGSDLNSLFKSQLEKSDIKITEKRITGIYNMGKYFALLSDQEEFDARTVIIATGVETVRAIPGERELLGRGVSYCATCDGTRYKGKTIAVICESAELEEEARYLAEIAGKVYYYPLFSSSFTSDNTERLSFAVSEIAGDGRVSGIVLKDGSSLDVDGVFFLKQSVSPAILMHGLEEENGHVAVNRKAETNIRGCFAAGDCTGAPYQIAKAIGEGNIAVHSAIKYLAAVSATEEAKNS